MGRRHPTRSLKAFAWFEKGDRAGDIDSSYSAAEMLLDVNAPEYEGRSQAERKLSDQRAVALLQKGVAKADKTSM